MILYLVRHAWAGQFGDPAWPDDTQRPLSPEGKTRFARVVQMLVERGFRPELIATSPLLRCRQTAELIAAGSQAAPPVVVRQALAPSSNLESLLHWTIQEAADCRQVAWVGHAPDVGEMTAALVGDGSAWIRFAKGATAAIEFGEALAAGEGQLRWLVSAKLLGC